MGHTRNLIYVHIVVIDVKQTFILFFFFFLIIQDNLIPAINTVANGRPHRATGMRLPNYQNMILMADTVSNFEIKLQKKKNNNHHKIKIHRRL